MSIETRTETVTMPEVRYQWVPAVTQHDSADVPSDADQADRWMQSDPAMAEMRRIEGTDRAIFYHFPSTSTQQPAAIIDGGWYMPDVAGDLCSGMVLIAEDEHDATA